ncbi:MAG: hypothetical protein ACMG6S_32895 [Byssovorax sp.]
MFAHAALSLRLMRLGARVGRVEAKELELLRSIAAVQEIGALRGAVTVREIAVSQSFKPEPKAEEDPEEQRATLATAAPTHDAEPGEDNEVTTVFDSEALCHALRSTPWLGVDPEEEEPARQERSAMLVTAFHHPPEKEGTPWPP